MTRVGQILVILLTCFSLVFMAFAVSVYSTRTNWMAKYTIKVAELKKVTDEKIVLDQQFKSLGESITEEIKKRQQAADIFTKQIKDQQDNYAKLLDNWKQARQDVVKFEQDANLALIQAKDRFDEAVRLREQLKTTQEQKEIAQKKQFETEQEKIDLQGSYETAIARLKELEQRSAELLAILDSHGLSDESKEKTKQIINNPPTVEGIVMEVDKEGKFVKISIGSDAGLRKQHKLQVYRVKPQGKFVGTIEIIEVDPDRAVARILPNLKQGTIQEGDLVATRITASR